MAKFQDTFQCTKFNLNLCQVKKKIHDISKLLGYIQLNKLTFLDNVERTRLPWFQNDSYMEGDSNQGFLN